MVSVSVLLLCFDFTQRYTGFVHKISLQKFTTNFSEISRRVGHGPRMWLAQIHSHMDSSSSSGSTPHPFSSVCQCRRGELMIDGSVSFGRSIITTDRPTGLQTCSKCVHTMTNGHTTDHYNKHRVYTMPDRSNDRSNDKAASVYAT